MQLLEDMFRHDSYHHQLNVLFRFPLFQIRYSLSTLTISNLQYSNIYNSACACKCTSVNRPFSYSRYWTGTSLEVRLMQGSLFKCKLHSSLFNDIPPHEPPLQASSSPIPKIRKWPITESSHNIQKAFSFRCL